MFLFIVIVHVETWATHIRFDTKFIERSHKYYMKNDQLFVKHLLNVSFALWMM